MTFSVLSLAVSTFSGALKEIGGLYTDAAERMAEQEDYLGIAPDKRYKPKSSDPEKRHKELEYIT